MSIGEALADARRQAGLTVSCLSDRAHVREAIITDVEGDDYSACGGDDYARGYIRIIARAVGADPEPLIREYNTARPVPQPITDDITEPITRVRMRKRPALVTAKASSADSRPTANGSLSGTVHRVAGASALAQLVGQLVSFVQTIALARLLTPTDIGIFAAGTVLTALLTNFVEGGLQAGLVQRQGDLADADETVFRVTLMVGAAASLGCLAAAPVIGIIFNSRTAGLIAAATAGVVFIHSLTNVPEAVLQREFSVKRRLIAGPAIAVSYAVVAVSLAALGWGVWAMVAGMYASYITWVVSLWMITSWRPGRGHASFAMWRELARYGFPLVLAMISSRLRTAVEALVVGRVLSTAALGFFRYGQRIALIPQVGIIQVGAITLFPAFSRIAGDPETLRRRVPACAALVHGRRRSRHGPDDRRG